MQLPAIREKISQLLRSHKILALIFLIVIFILATEGCYYFLILKKDRQGEGIIDIPVGLDEPSEQMIRGRVRSKENRVLIIEASNRLLNVEIPDGVVFFDEQMEPFERDAFDEIKKGQRIAIGGVERRGENYYVGKAVFLTSSSVYYKFSNK